MHGILDTSIGWVANGVTGSQAFAAYDAGFDVWLGNSRANPPIDHIGNSHIQIKCPCRHRMPTLDAAQVCSLGIAGCQFSIC